MSDSRSGPSGRWTGDPRWAGLDEQILDDTEFPAGAAGDADEAERDLAALRRDADGRDNAQSILNRRRTRDRPGAGEEGVADTEDEGGFDSDDERVVDAGDERVPASGADGGLDTDDDGGLDEGALFDDDDDAEDDEDDPERDDEDDLDLGSGSGSGSGDRQATQVDVLGERARVSDRDPDLADRFAEVTDELIQRWPEARVDPTLSRIRMLCDLLGDPQAAVPAIHLTGTNGKTSTARMTETLLRGLGLRTGTYTSPHLQDVRERILLDGRPVSIARFVELYEEIEPYLALVDARSENPVSFFEALTTMGFAAFADAPVDVAVLEVGLGGTWDATNVADARVAVLTHIGVDHAHLLGDTAVKVAAEKVGIIKPGAIVVSARQDPDVLAVVRTHVEQVGAQLLQAGEDFDVTSRQVAVGGQLLSLRTAAASYDDVFLPMHGAHQADNAACALAAAEAFFGGGQRPLRAEAVTAAFAAVSSPARLELVAQRPAVVLDAAHNPDGARAAAAGVRESFGFQRVVGVVGVMADKDVAGVLSELAGTLDEVVLTQNSTSRAMPAGELAQVAAGFWPAQRLHVEPDLGAAIALGRALASAGPGGGGAPGPVGGAPDGLPPRAGIGPGPAGVLVTGSVVTAGQARTLLARSQPGGS